MLGVKKGVNSSKRGVFQNDKVIASVIKSRDIVEELIKALSTFTLAIRAAPNIMAQTYIIYK